MDRKTFAKCFCDELLLLSYRQCNLVNSILLYSVNRPKYKTRLTNEIREIYILKQLHTM